MKFEYHVNLGDSNRGPIGYCARVWADSREQAVERLRAVLPDCANLLPDRLNFDEGTPAALAHPHVVYVEAYLNAAAIGVDSTDFASACPQCTTEAERQAEPVRVDELRLCPACDEGGG